MPWKIHILAVALTVCMGCGTGAAGDAAASAERGDYTRILDADRAVAYFDRHLELDATQQGRIKELALYYQGELGRVPSGEQSKNTARYAIKLASHVIREVLTMEQAEHFVETDKMAAELFGE